MEGLNKKKLTKELLFVTALPGSASNQRRFRNMAEDPGSFFKKNSNTRKVVGVFLKIGTAFGMEGLSLSLEIVQTLFYETVQKQNVVIYSHLCGECH